MVLFCFFIFFRRFSGVFVFVFLVFEGDNGIRICVFSSKFLVPVLLGLFQAYFAGISAFLAYLGPLEK
jgi:hypothetical protein